MAQLITYTDIDELQDTFLGANYGLSSISKGMLYDGNRVLVAGRFLSTNTITAGGVLSHNAHVNATAISPYFRTFVGLDAINIGGTDYAFVANYGTYASRNALIAFDISDINNPTYAGHEAAFLSADIGFRGICTGQVGASYYAWICVFEGNRVIVSDISVPNSPVFSYRMTEYNPWRIGFWSIAGTDYLVVSARQSAGGDGQVSIYNVNNPLVPVSVASITSLPGIPRGTTIATINGHRLLFVTTSAGFSVWNIDTIASPSLVGNSTNLHSLWDVAVGQHNGVDYAFCASTAMLITYEISDSAAPDVADYKVDGFGSGYTADSMTADIDVLGSNPTIVIVPGSANFGGTPVNLLATFETADATTSGTFTLDAIIQAAASQTFTFTIDGIILTAADVDLRTVIASRETDTFTVDAIISAAATTSTFTADIVIQLPNTRLFTIDAIIQSTKTATFTLDAIIEATGTSTFTVDAIIKMTVTSTFTLDAYISNLSTVTVDAIVFATETSTFTIDAQIGIGVTGAEIVAEFVPTMYMRARYR